MKLSKKKERQVSALLEKKQKAYDKFYEEYKDKSLEELKEIYQRIKPGGVRKAAMLDIVNGKMELVQAEILNAVATEPRSNIEDAQVVICEECEGTGKNFYSCCGIDMRGKDNDFCPECKEHTGWDGLEKAEPCDACRKNKKDEDTV